MGHLSLSFYIQFFKQCVNIIPQCVLTSSIEKKIVLVRDVYFRPRIIIRFHDLQRRVSSLPSLVPMGSLFFGLSLAFPFVFHMMVPTIGFYWIFFSITMKLASGSLILFLQNLDNNENDVYMYVLFIPTLLCIFFWPWYYDVKFLNIVYVFDVRIEITIDYDHEN
jgi:hypothetical protein